MRNKDAVFTVFVNIKVVLVNEGFSFINGLALGPCFPVEHRQTARGFGLEKGIMRRLCHRYPCPGGIFVQFGCPNGH